MNVSLVLNDNFTSGLRLAADAAAALHQRMTRDAATWEPHDWSEWDE